MNKSTLLLMKNCGKKVRMIRMSLGLSADDFEKLSNHKIKATNLRMIEGGHIKLVIDKAKIIKDTCRSAGLYIDLDWLLLDEELSLEPWSLSKSAGDEISNNRVKEELERRGYGNIIKVTNNDLYPLYKKGEYVCCVMRDANLIESDIYAHVIRDVWDNYHFKYLLQDKSKKFLIGADIALNNVEVFERENIKRLGIIFGKVDI